MKRASTFLPVLIVTAALASLAIAGCGSATAGTPADATVAGGAFAGYKWQVVTITHAGKQTPIPARYDVYLSFARSGQFGANEPVNYHGGTYRTTGDGFTTGPMSSTAAGYGGHDPVTLLAVSAISAFNPGVDAATTMNGNRLAVTVGGYQLGCQRDGAA
ncbi:MAG TPA: hypothetical protein VHZ96_25350 [Frankiaceae bacterium]|jgi:hypothetical protein|nr:hypothetical protein [Frankiaceae bacterium]